jgi:riboflavin synthase
MFTGLIQKVGHVAAVASRADGLRLEIAVAGDPGTPEANSLARGTGSAKASAALDSFADVQIGESIAVNGVCLTVAAMSADRLIFDAVRETLEQTTLRELATGAAVNLERALRIGEHLGGHFVQGHVDGIGTVSAVTQVGSGKEMEISVPEELAQQMIMKGSVALDGVSLTVAGLSLKSFRVALVPHTLAATTLGGFSPGRKVNIETDLIGKWVLRTLENRSSRDAISVEKLRELGF